MVFLALLVVGLGATFAGCGQSGIGSPCIAGTAGEGNLKVVIGTGECSTNICVSYLASAGYCTVECVDNSACPGGYLCCPVVQTGPMNSCQTDANCTARQSCRQGVCRPKQFCVQGQGTCQ